MVDKPNEPAPEEQGLASKALKLAAYPVAAISGLWVTKINIEDAAYDRLKARGGFERANFSNAHNPEIVDIQPQHKAAHRALVLEAEENIRKGIPNADFATKSHIIDKAYHPKVEARFTEMGLGNISEKWTYLSRSQRQNAVLNGLTVSAIAIGALLTMADSKTLSHLFAKKDAQKEQDSPSR